MPGKLTVYDLPRPDTVIVITFDDISEVADHNRPG